MKPKICWIFNGVFLKDLKITTPVVSLRFVGHVFWFSSLEGWKHFHAETEIPMYLHGLDMRRKKNIEFSEAFSEHLSWKCSVQCRSSVPAHLAWGWNTLFQKGHRACNQYLVASWLPCFAPWAWSLSSIRVTQKIPSDLGFWAQPPYVELFLILVQNLAGRDGYPEPLKNSKSIFVGDGVCLFVWWLLGLFYFNNHG